MKKHFFLGFVLMGLCLTQLSAQIATKQELQQKKQELLQQRQQMTSEQINDYYKAVLSRKPKFQAPYLLQDAVSDLLQSKDAEGEQGGLNIPPDAIFPIESDEVEAIMMTWVYDTRTLSGAYAQQVFDGWGIVDYYSNNLVQVVNVPDVSPNSDYANLFAELANGIQKHAQVWITLWAEEDSTAILDFMSQRGTPLTNYRFFYYPGNAFWFRDFGPIVFYYGDEDERAFLDFEYYGGRPLDDQIPIHMAEELGWNNYVTTIEYEGGNILVDGLGTLFTTDAVYGTNQDTYGLAYMDSTTMKYYSKPALTKQQICDSLMYLMNLDRLRVLPALRYDGGTGHIDLYCDMWEESSFVVAQYPEVMANLSDPKLVEKNLDTLLSMEDFFGENYTAVRIPLPRRNNGTWYTSQSSYNNSYTRAFSNHTFVNDAIIQPVFFDTTRSGSAAGDIEGNRQALNVLQRAYPGYKFEPIDVRSFDGFGGAIHCITKQVPADNPVRILHQPTRFLNTTDNPVESIRLEALCQNKSGIDNVKLYYRYGNEGEFTELACSVEEEYLFAAQVPLQANVSADTLTYYFSATSNNGKTITKPMTAPEGYYSMPYGTEVNAMISWNPYDSIEFSLPRVSLSELEGISDIYPNPAVDKATITLNLSQDIYFRVVNVKGQTQQQGRIPQGSTTFQFDTQNLSNGNYFVILSDGNLSTIKKLVVK